ncbi:hypothetical protein IT403_00145 [Candidatus Nomurabacteria bacterium]|nr:hypothetical protein [Candidatus Nomurabacteria bacterium]
MKKSAELKITTLFDEKNLQRVSPFVKELYTFDNCTNRPLDCLIVDKSNTSKVGRIFGALRDKREVYCAIEVSDKKIRAYFCGEQKRDMINTILENFSKEYGFELTATQQEKKELPLKCFRDLDSFFSTDCIRRWWNQLFVGHIITLPSV